VPHLSPTTLTTDEQRLILRATAGNVRDHTIISLALGTGLRLAEIAATCVATDDELPLSQDGRIAVRLEPFTWSPGKDPAYAPTLPRPRPAAGRFARHGRCSTKERGRSPCGPSELTLDANGVNGPLEGRTEGGSDVV
jgi:hypothetical protein